jgi:hypothetical protein
MILELIMPERAAEAVDLPEKLRPVKRPQLVLWPRWSWKIASSHPDMVLRRKFLAKTVSMFLTLMSSPRTSTLGPLGVL